MDDRDIDDGNIEQSRGRRRVDELVAAIRSGDGAARTALYNQLVAELGSESAGRVWLQAFAGHDASDT
jgi:hypothetical protein